MTRRRSVVLLAIGVLVGVAITAFVVRFARAPWSIAGQSITRGESGSRESAFQSQLEALLAGRLETRTVADGRDYVLIPGKGYASVPMAIRLLLEGGCQEIADTERRVEYLESAIAQGFDLLSRGDSRGMAFLIFAGDQHFGDRDYQAAADLWARAEQKASSRTDRALAAAMLGQNLELLGQTIRAGQAYRRVVAPEGGVDVSPGGPDRELWEPYLRAARGLAGLSLAQGNIPAAAEANIAVVENSSAQDLRRPDVQAALQESLWMANRAERYADTIRIVEHVLAIDPDFGMNTSRRLSLELERARAVARGGQDAAVFAQELKRLWDDPRNHGHALTINLASNLVSSLVSANRHLETITYADEVLAEISEVIPTLSEQERERYADDTVIAQIMLARAIALDTMGSVDEATGAFLELMERYPGSQEAQIAEANLGADVSRPTR